MSTLVVLPLGTFGVWQIVIIVLVVLILFGGKKIPEFMRGLGKGVKEFKNGMDDVEKTINSDSKTGKDEKVLEPDKIEKTK